MNKHSHIYLYTFIHSGMTWVHCKWHRFFSRLGSRSEATTDATTDATTSGPFLSSTVTSSTDLGWRDIVNFARRSAAVSSGLTAAYDRLSSTTFENTSLSTLTRHVNKMKTIWRVVWRRRRRGGRDLSDPCSNLGMSEPEETCLLCLCRTMPLHQINKRSTDAHELDVIFTW